MPAEHGHWQPCASLPNLRQRALLLQQVRAFFAQRAVMEVETPILASAPVSDPHIQCVGTQNPQQQGESIQPAHWLRSSPEYFHKRLLAAGSGDIYELGKVFRRGEAGRWHNPEFTMLEWYRVGWQYHQLMDEVAELVLQLLANFEANAENQAAWPVQRLSYRELHQQILNVDPFQLNLAEWQVLAAEHGYHDASHSPLAILQDFVYGVAIRQHLPTRQLSFIYDFPLHQSALARIRPGNPAVAERFELFMGQVEIANGYQELTNAAEQRDRFTHDQQLRAAYAMPQAPSDEFFLSALAHGLPECSGVAMGIDRLFALIRGETQLAHVMSFTVGNS